MDATLVRMTQKLDSQMVLLTIAISGGPFLGLLGTVVGVMITFAAIAASGDVNVNSIAPGIAAALAATVAGLAVAIPALFGYNWLNTRIKEINADLRVFVDEFVTRDRGALQLMSASADEKDVYDEINITPMLDLAYVLLVIFIIMTTASVQGITVNLPKASETPAIAKPKTKAISITADGTIYLDTYPVTLAELERLLTQYKAADPELPVIVKADATIQYQKVVDVLDLIGRLEISQLGLVTQRVVK